MRNERRLPLNGKILSLSPSLGGGRHEYNRDSHSRLEERKPLSQAKSTRVSLIANDKAPDTRQLGSVPNQEKRTEPPRTVLRVTCQSVPCFQTTISLFTH
ncbi:hypothetical protein O9929_13530 [Vibrio lentus]|nr:hypothetical protein [Vibrio lentus]